MNGKTVKLLRKWAKLNAVNPETIKTLWKATPRNLRGKTSKRIKAELKAAKEEVAETK